LHRQAGDLAAKFKTYQTSKSKTDMPRWRGAPQFVLFLKPFQSQTVLHKTLFFLAEVAAIKAN